MPEPLTPDRIAEIRARLDAATPGPWEWRNSAELHLLSRAPGRYCVMAFERMGMQGAQPLFRRGELLYPAGKSNIYEYPDADLIANAPTDLADLLAEVERLTAENAKLRAAVEAVAKIHRPTPVYDECTHDDCQAEQIEVYDYMACADSFTGWGCETCCYDDEFPIEECPHGADHRGVSKHDACPTWAAIDAWRDGES